MSTSNVRVLTWDAAVRVFHWALAAIIVFNLLRDEGDFVHHMAGYAAERNS